LLEKKSILLILTELLYLLFTLWKRGRTKSKFMLRKLSVVVIGLLITAAINAQFRRGDKMVGASIGTVFFNHSNTDLSTSLLVSSTSNDNYGINFNPSLGWFVSDNIAIGIMPTVGYSKQKILGKTPTGNTFIKDESNRFNVGIGGFARYYLPGENTKARFFGQYDLSVSLGGSKRDGFEYERNGIYVDRYDYKSSGDFFANTGISLGVSKFLSNKTALDIYFGYKLSYIKSNTTGNFSRDYTNPATADETERPDYVQKLTGHNLTLGVGFQIFLDKKR
jgi:hypothetical protein